MTMLMGAPRSDESSADHPGSGAGAEKARLLTHFDAATGLIRVEGNGLWSPDYVDAHFAELKTLADRVRARAGRVRAMVDLRAAGVQPAETAGRIAHGTSNTFELGDRIAVVVGSSLAKAQLRKIVDSRNYELFISESAALIWLRAYG